MSYSFVNSQDFERKKIFARIWCYRVEFTMLLVKLKVIRRSDHSFVPGFSVTSRAVCGTKCTVSGIQLCVGFNYIWDPATMDAPVCQMFVRTDSIVVH